MQLRWFLSSRTEVLDGALHDEHGHYAGCFHRPPKQGGITDKDLDGAFNRYSMGPSDYF